MTADRPELTVVIPTRNRAEYLTEALESALGQIGVELEVLVVDDGSADTTPTLLAAVDDARLRVLRFDSSQGIGRARNSAIAEAQGEWIAFLDDDDLWSPDKSRLQLAAARREGATWAYCGVLLVSAEGDVMRMWGPPDPATILRDLLQRNVVQAGCSTVLVRADRLREVGAFEEDLSSPWDLWIRLAIDGKAASVGEPLVAYRRHGSTFITGNKNAAMREARRIAEKHRRLADEHGVAFDLNHLEHWLDSEAVRGLRTAAAVQLREGRRLDASRLQLRVLLRSRSWSDLRRLGRIMAGDHARSGFRALFPTRELADGEREPVPAWLARYLTTGQPQGSPSKYAGRAPRA